MPPPPAWKVSAGKTDPSLHEVSSIFVPCHRHVLTWISFINPDNIFHISSTQCLYFRAHAKHCVLLCAVSRETLEGWWPVYRVRRKWFSMVCLLIHCCPPAINFQVIYCNVARLSAITMWTNHRWPGLSIRYSLRHLSVPEMVLLESTFLRYNLDTVLREIPLPVRLTRWSDPFVELQQFSHAQMHLDPLSYPYYVWLLMIP